MMNDWSYQTFETPTHVYTIFNNFRQNLIDDIMVLEALQERDRYNLNQILIKWQRYFNGKNDEQSSKQIKNYMDFF